MTTRVAALAALLPVLWACSGSVEPGGAPLESATAADTYAVVPDGSPLHKDAAPVDGTALVLTDVKVGDEIQIEFSGQAVVSASAGASLVAMVGDTMITNGGWSASNTGAGDNAYPVSFFSVYTAEASGPASVRIDGEVVFGEASIHGGVMHVHVSRP